jgi:hypothetical protein
VTSLGIKLQLESYVAQLHHWPATGRVILAQYDSDSVVVYQAYRPTTGQFAARHGFFGGEFSYNRMSWVKPNFLWMMYRSGWGTKESQETTLAVRIRRSAFDAMLAAAVHSTYVPGIHASEDLWRQQVANSDVRLQWDPDHAPDGRPVDRRAIQLGLRGEFLRKYGREWIVAIEDVSLLVAEQRTILEARGESGLATPRERPYPVKDPSVAAKLGLD